MTAKFTNTRETITSNLLPVEVRRSRAVGLVPFLFGVAGTEQLAGVALVALLGELGIGVAAARGQLARMRRNGQLGTSQRGRGREVDYRLIGPFAATFRRLSSPPAPPPPWEGHFHAVLHHVPEPHRAYRDRLRRLAQLIGYGVMQQGVLIAVADHHDDLAAVLAQAPPGCRIQRATIGLPVSDAAQVARSAWDLARVGNRLRDHIAALSAATETDETPTASAATLRRLAQLRNAPLIDLISDPGLPAELLPHNWPAHELVRHLDRIAEHYLPPAIQYVHAVLAGPPAQQSRPPPCTPAAAPRPRHRSGLT